MSDFFKVKKITDLNNATEDMVFPTSDFATLTPSGKFVQLEYVEGEEGKLEPYQVKPGIWAIQKTGQRLKLYTTQFVTDKILDSFISTKHITDKIDCFFNRIPVYYEMGFEVAKRAALLYGPAGCHAKGTEILMYDGTVKKVEDVIIGDKLMGPDSQPREVLRLARGREEMLKVTPTKGESFVVNKNHVFHITPSHKNEIVRCPINMVGVSLLEDVTLPFRERFKLTRTGVDFPEKELPIDPYILGLWLGDGDSGSTTLTTMDSEIKDIWCNYAKEFDLIVSTTHNGSKAYSYHLSYGPSHQGMKKAGRNKLLSLFQEFELINNKHIPHYYLTSSRKQRLEILAGLIDSDGYYGGSLEITTKFDRLASDILYLSRSLGFAAYSSKQEKLCQTGNGGIYNRITISGNIHEIPVKLKRKRPKVRKQIKDVLRTGFKLEVLPEDDYYGFSLDKDHLYLTADFTIHHNSGKSTAITQICTKYSDGETAVIIWHTDKFEAYQVKDFIKSFEYVGVKKLILIAEDIGGIEVDQAKMKSDSSLLSLLDNQEKTFTIPTFILATTNYPANFMGNLTNRPNRFDDKIEVGYPTASQRKALLDFFGKDLSTDDAKDLLASNSCKEFTPAHIREIVIRSKIYDKTILEVIKEMCEEIATYNRMFQKGGRMGFDD